MAVAADITLQRPQPAGTTKPPPQKPEAEKPGDKQEESLTTGLAYNDKGGVVPQVDPAYIAALTLTSPSNSASPSETLALKRSASPELDKDLRNYEAAFVRAHSHNDLDKACALIQVWVVKPILYMFHKLSSGEVKSLEGEIVAAKQPEMRQNVRKVARSYAELEVFC